MVDLHKRIDQTVRVVIGKHDGAQKHKQRDEQHPKQHFAHAAVQFGQIGMDQQNLRTVADTDAAVQRHNRKIGKAEIPPMKITDF